jgi:hypothetical protein
MIVWDDLLVLSKKRHGPVFKVAEFARKLVKSIAIAKINQVFFIISFNPLQSFGNILVQS